MKRILGYEIKKILKKKSTQAAFVILFLANLFLAFSPCIGKTYVEDEVLESHFERNRTDRKNGIAMSGKLIDDSLLLEVQKAYGKIEGMDALEYLVTDTYQQEVRPYSDVMDTLSNVWMYGTSLNPMTVTAEDLYKTRYGMLQEYYEYYELTEKEKEYWEEKNKALPDKFTYVYSCAYQYLTEMSHGCYMLCLLLTFFVAICLGNVFNDEQVLRTDQLVLCTRKGRNTLYFAKILAGTIVVTVSSVLFECVSVLGMFVSFGTEGADALLQAMQIPWYPYELTLGQTFIIQTGLFFLAMVLIGIVTMVLAYVLHNSIGAMAIMIGGAFVARLVFIPVSFGALSQLWNYIPLNLLKLTQGFTDLRLVPFIGGELTTWQAAPFLYILMGVLIVLAGKTIYCNGEIKGR